VEDNDQKTNDLATADRFIVVLSACYGDALAREPVRPNGSAFVKIDDESTEDKVIESLSLLEHMSRDLRIAKSKSPEDRVVTKGIVAEVFIENNLKDIEQVSKSIDDYNARISEKLAVLDHMETRVRLNLDELEAMVAKL
jgi:RNA recognition motif-containing protein